jgi:pimeloyl-ACP methyl ester carboxylesterase
MVATNGVNICTQAFGDPANPALLMILGANVSMLAWDAELCQQLADGGRYVIRYDNRDMGRSTAYPPYAPPYTLEDLARDAVGILDAYGIERAHAVGASSGGMIAQLLAIHHAERIISITAISSTPDPKAVIAAMQGKVTEDTLPAPAPAVFELIDFLAKVDWSDEVAAIEALVIEGRALSGSAYPFDEAWYRGYATREYRRAQNILSMRFNHPIAEGNTPRWRDQLRDVRVPTLVMHGSADSVLPFAHGVALAKDIPGAKFLTLDGVDHILPRGAWPIVVPAILSHTAGSQDQAHNTTRETFQLESSRLVEQAKQLLQEGNVRRIVVKQDERTIVEFPLAVGVVGTLLAAPLAALGALAALLNDCTIEVERAGSASAAESPAASARTSTASRGSVPGRHHRPRATGRVPPGACSLSSSSCNR